MPFQMTSATPALLIDRAGQHEQQIAQPIQVNQHGARPRIRRLFGELDDQAFGAPADRACQMEIGGRRHAAGQDELSQRLELGVEPVDRAFEMLDVSLGDGVVELGRPEEDQRVPSPPGTARLEAGPTS